MKTNTYTPRAEQAKPLPRYYVKQHLTRDGQSDGWDVREVTGRVDVCFIPCDSEEEAREELAATIARATSEP